MNKRLAVILPFILLLSTAVLLACSSSDNSDGSTDSGPADPNSSNQEGQLAADNPIEIVDYHGTWVTDCLPVADSNMSADRHTFIYDGDRAVFLSVSYSDVDCINGNSLAAKSGTMTFGQSIVESTYGVTSYKFTFISDNALADDFVDIIYTSDELLYFGDTSSISEAGQTPVALDASRIYNFSGVADYSVFNSPVGPVMVTMTIEPIPDAQSQGSVERAIDVSNLVATAIINGSLVSLNKDASGHWVGLFEARANSRLDAQVNWSELYEGRLLKLAQWSQLLAVETLPVFVDVKAVDYFYNFDDDNDGLSNITERLEGTDPFDSNSP